MTKPTPSPEPKHSTMDLTNRDAHILRKALAYAIETIERLPEHLQSISDLQDMKNMFAIVCNDHDSTMAFYMGIARRHVALRENEG